PGTRCTFSCEPGYAMQGQATLHCYNNGSWSASFPTCKDTKPPIIVCPENIYTQTDPGKPTAKVTWPTPVPQDNADRKPRLRVEPKGMRSPHEFPAGDTMITYTSEDESGLTSSCSFLVTI
ncbi:predicted protein, partial [Nematostella vectensis]